MPQARPPPQKVTHAYPRVLTLFWGWGRGYPGSQRGPVGLSGARWMEICAIKHVSGRSAPKGALRPQARPLPGRMHVRYAWGRPGCPSGEAGVLGEQSGLGRKTPQQWIVVTHVQPLIPQEPPRTPAESQGRRLARQKSLPPSVSGLKSPEKTRFRQSFPCETTSRTLNRGRTSSVSGSIGPCAGLLNSQDTHHVRDTLVCHPYVQKFEI